MTEERINNYNSHATFLADIAQAIISGNKMVLDVNGVKEIIALYLLIPYMTDETLQTPDEMCIIPKLKGDFMPGISYNNLRDTICHSFVTVEEDKNNGSDHGKRLIFDDRLIVDRRTHSQSGYHANTINILIEFVHSRIAEMIKEINNQSINSDL